MPCHFCPFAFSFAFAARTLSARRHPQLCVRPHCNCVNLTNALTPHSHSHHTCRFFDPLVTIDGPSDTTTNRPYLRLTTFCAFIFYTSFLLSFTCHQRRSDPRSRVTLRVS